jgi:hypothetical protein
VSICRILMSVCVHSDLCVCPELPLQNASICALNLPCQGPTLGGVSSTVLDSCCQLLCPGISDIDHHGGTFYLRVSDRATRCHFFLISFSLLTIPRTTFLSWRASRGSSRDLVSDTLFEAINYSIQNGLRNIFRRMQHQLRDCRTLSLHAGSRSRFQQPRS